MLNEHAILLFPFSYALLCLLCGALSVIDLRQGILPDRLNLSVAVLGLAFAVIRDGAGAGAEAAIHGTVAGILFFLLQRLYRALRHRDGLGLGDVKFLAAATVWVGLAGVPLLLLIASLSALVAALSLQLAGQKMTLRTTLPFGPFLAAGLLVTLMLEYLTAMFW
ncbi:MAG: A24 family peptidase [Alphaproteobacteria bacterium]|nr:A24 family peptidase [Alphaproteobacteria bacterium]